ncbi:protein lin-10-like [Sarcoptes scabiei]|nr:protein lin-10-like [Sarcoptes scabiei]
MRFKPNQMHTSSSTSTTTLIAPQMETSIESKFSAAFEQQISSSGGHHRSNQLLNGRNNSSRSSDRLIKSKSQTAINSVAQNDANHQLNIQSPFNNLHGSISNNSLLSSSSSITATPNIESINGEKTVSFRKGNDLESFESLSSLLANGLFTDLVICCPGKMFKCHRIVMATASIYIRDALSAFYNNNPDNGSSSGGCNNCNTVMILPTEIKMSDMEAILRFIYDGHVEVKVDMIESFIRSARLLNIKGLSNVNIVFNNNGTHTATTKSTNTASPNNDDDTVTENSVEILASNTSTPHHHSKNGFSSKSLNSSNHNTNNLLNGHAGMNSPPPSPPLLNSSLASLKAMTAQSHLSNGTTNAANHLLSNKFLNGSLNSHLINQYRNNLRRDHSPLRNLNDSASASILSGQNNTPAHQSSTPKSIFNNNINPFSNSVTANINTNSNPRLDSSNSSVSSSGGGSRRKQKFPTNIALLTDMIPQVAATNLYNSWMNLNSEEDDEDELDENEDDKRLMMKDDSSNECGSTIGDNMSTTSVDSKQPPSSTNNQQSSINNLPFGLAPSFAPQMPCMIEVEADPTSFPLYSDFNDSQPLPQQQSHQKRRRNFKSPYQENRPHSDSKKAKLPFLNQSNSNSSVDVTIRPTSPSLIHHSASHHDSPVAAILGNSAVDIVPKPKHNGNGTRSSSVPASEKSIFGYPSVKTAAGANPSASSPSSSSSASGSWVGSKWKCDICNKYYGNKQTLKEHMDYFHSNREEQIYICNICKKEYTWRKSLMKHYRDIHQMRNTPALAEINRQLAALAAAKGRSGLEPALSPASSANGGPSPSDNSDPNQLQSFVSLSNFNSDQKSGSKESSELSDKSNRSESELDNDNNDFGGGEEEFGQEEVAEGSCTTDVDLHEETLSINEDSSAATKCDRQNSRPDDRNDTINDDDLGHADTEDEDEDVENVDDNLSGGEEDNNDDDEETTALKLTKTSKTSTNCKAIERPSPVPSALS